MSLSYTLAESDDLRRRLLVRIGAPLTHVEPLVAAANSLVTETPQGDAFGRIASGVYETAQRGGTTGDSGAL